MISIHAPLAGSDNNFEVKANEMQISIHAPLAGSDIHHKANGLYDIEFQSTLPSRGATHILHILDAVIHISIHAPLAGSDLRSHGISQQEIISIHAPLAGSDRQAV